MDAMTYKFPAPSEHGPARTGATVGQKLIGRARNWFCTALSQVRAPGFIRPVRIDDSLTGDHIEVRTSGLFTRVSVNGRDYFFDRLTGRFDGTGSGCA